MYVCSYIRLLVCVYACMYVCMHAVRYVCICVCIHVHMSVCVHVFALMSMNAKHAMWNVDVQSTATKAEKYSNVIFCRCAAGHAMISIIASFCPGQLLFVRIKSHQQCSFPLDYICCSHSHLGFVFLSSLGQ